MKQRTRSRRSGFTLIETLTASSVGSLVIFGITSTLLMGMAGWAKGQGAINSSTDSQKSIRMIAGELREAMEVVVDANGLGLTYKLPAKAGTDYAQPIAWDGITRRIRYRVDDGVGMLEIGSGGAYRVLAKNVSNVDPSNGNAYQIFVPGAGTLTREVQLKLTLDNKGDKAEREKTIAVESFYLRNIPVTTR